jgi:hypothetical protein
MSLNIAVSIPLSIAISIHQSSDHETGSLNPETQQRILKSIVSAIKSLPDDPEAWGPSSEDSQQYSEESSHQDTTPPEPEIRVSFSETETHIPPHHNNHHRRIPSLHFRRSSLKDTSALQKPTGPDITFPGAQFAFEVRHGNSSSSAKSIAVAAHGGVTMSELAIAIWKKEGVPMREQRLYLGGEELYNGRAHERDGVYEGVRLRGKFVSIFSLLHC